MDNVPLGTFLFGTFLLCLINIVYQVRNKEIKNKIEK